MGAERKGERVEQVTLLKQDEVIRLDQDQLNALFARLGPAGGEDVACRAMEELAIRLTQVERCYRDGQYDQMRKGARSLAAIADQIGMNTLARVARDLTQCIDAGDGIAMSAVLARLLRSGERSLTAVWDMQDLSV